MMTAVSTVSRFPSSTVSTASTMRRGMVTLSGEGGARPAFTHMIAEEGAASKPPSPPPVGTIPHPAPSPSPGRFRLS